jgi:hypothetical protein
MVETKMRSVWYDWTHEGQSHVSEVPGIRRAFSGRDDTDSYPRWRVWHAVHADRHTGDGAHDKFEDTTGRCSTPVEMRVWLIWAEGSRDDTVYACITTIYDCADMNDVPVYSTRWLKRFHTCCPACQEKGGGLGGGLNRCKRRHVWLG